MRFVQRLLQNALPYCRFLAVNTVRSAYYCQQQKWKNISSEFSAHSLYLSSTIRQFTSTNTEQTQAATEKDNSLLAEIQFEEQLEHILRCREQCPGCGAQLQFKSDKIAGYLEHSKAINILRHNAQLKDLMAMHQISVRSSREVVAEQIIESKLIDGEAQAQVNSKTGQLNINDLEMLQQLAENQIQNLDSNVPNEQNQEPNSQANKHQETQTDHYDPERAEQEIQWRQMLCQRCHALKYGQYEKQGANAESISRHFMDEEEYFKKIFKQIKRNSTIILFVDVCELYSTFASRLFEVCIHQNFKMVIVINKIDTLPKDAIQVQLVKDRLRDKIRHLHPELLPQLEDIFAVSSRTGVGMRGFISYLRAKKITSVRQQQYQYCKNFYVLGYTNTGKSSFLNLLNRMTDKRSFKTGEVKSQDPVLQKILENADQSEYFRYQQNSQDSRIYELTTSPIPNTTLEFVALKNMSLDVTLYDTPGLPHPRQLTSLFNNPIDARLLVHTKEISPRVVRLESELTLFLGALLRIDLLPRDNEQEEGLYYCEQINVHLFTTLHVSVQVTKTAKANETYIKQYGKELVPVLAPDLRDVHFKRHRLYLSFDAAGVCDKDLEIAGLGWFSFSNSRRKDGRFAFDLYLPERAVYMLRNSIIRFNQKQLHNRISRRPSKTRPIQRHKMRLQLEEQQTENNQ